MCINSKTKQQGFSLLELMVSIAIAGIVFAGVMGAMNSLSSKTSSNEIDLQVKAEIAFSYIGGAFKEAGASVCDNFIRGIMAGKQLGPNGFLMVNTVLDNWDQTAIDGLGFPITADNISAGTFINDGIGTLRDSNNPTTSVRVAGRAMGSDMINMVSTGEKMAVINYISPGMTPLQHSTMRQFGPMTLSGRPSNIPINAVSDTGNILLPTNPLNRYTFILSNCDTEVSEIFEATISATTPGSFPFPQPSIDLNFVNPLTMSDPSSPDGTLEVAALRSTTYFINQTGNGLSLSRFYGFNFAGANSLVFGVEMMSVQWGVDIDGDFEVDRFIASDNQVATSGDNIINNAFSFTWDQVVAARVDIIVGESDARGNVNNQYQLNFPVGSQQIITYQRGQNPVITDNSVPQPLPAEFNGIGHYARKVFSKTFAFRNKVGI